MNIDNIYVRTFVSLNLVINKGSHLSYIQPSMLGYMKKYKYFYLQGFKCIQWNEYWQQSFIIFAHFRFLINEGSSFSHNQN